MPCFLHFDGIVHVHELSNFTIPCGSIQPQNEIKTLPAQNPSVHQPKDEQREGKMRSMYVRRAHDLFIYFKVHVSSNALFYDARFLQMSKNPLYHRNTWRLVFNFVFSLPFYVWHFYFVIMVADFIEIGLSIWQIIKVNACDLMDSIGIKFRTRLLMVYCFDKDINPIHRHDTHKNYGKKFKANNGAGNAHNQNWKYMLKSQRKKQQKETFFFLVFFSIFVHFGSSAYVESVWSHVHRTMFGCCYYCQATTPWT